MSYFISMKKKKLINYRDLHGIASPPSLFQRHSYKLTSRAETVEMAEIPETVAGPLFIANCMAVKCISKSRSISIFSNPGKRSASMDRMGVLWNVHENTYYSNFTNIQITTTKIYRVYWLSLKFCATEVTRNTKNRCWIGVFD